MHSDALGAYFLPMEYHILQGDCIEQLRTMEANSVHTCVTSPPYYRLRDYGHDGQIGLEETPEAYVAKLVEVFREVRRVLRNDGTLWLNLGDTYKEKQLLGIPWRVAFALQADRWFLRQDIIWHKPNPMPESVKDRCTKAHEYIFLFSKSNLYYFDADKIKEEANNDSGFAKQRAKGKQYEHKKPGNIYLANREECQYGLNKAINTETRNRRSVWTVPTRPYSGAHFAVFPPELIRPCILAGCPPSGFVLDPFGGSGTTAEVAIQEGRNAVIIEVNQEFIKLAHKRISGTQMPLI
jgi:site-specific DNA-methyltransferase (adenine-specific)